MNRLKIGTALQALQRWFPDREFIMRSDGHVRYVRLSSRLQLRVAGFVGAVALCWLGTMSAVAINSWLGSREAASLLDREAKVATAESRITAYRQNVDAVADDLVRRQSFIEQMVKTHVGSLPADAKSGETVSDSRSEAAKTVRKVSMAIPEAAPLARIEAEQLVFVERLTRLADRRSAAAAAAMRKLGLDPGRMLAALDDRGAMGGPLIPVETGSSRTLDPRFERLGLSLARMDALERGLEGIPQVLPADLDYVSSGFGLRRDPFTGSAAFHPGLDFRGPIGAPIFAAARGVVSFVGQRNGYGNCVEVDHGNGLLTRYAHMSAFRSHVGQRVAAGDLIGAVGSTGRSTGPHLHFEVRIAGQAVNPRPFLEVAPHVLEEARSRVPAV